ncbi:hypothetical protein yaldo0001_2680 [Yersinia aldovae ATCC 35236]|nr:hypothetical protein yaldo0001_2680 [Yersinia aldovae ATCC 35236]
MALFLQQFGDDGEGNGDALPLPDLLSNTANQPVIPRYGD